MARGEVGISVLFVGVGGSSAAVAGAVGVVSDVLARRAGRPCLCVCVCSSPAFCFLLLSRSAACSLYTSLEVCEWVCLCVVVC